MAFLADNFTPSSGTSAVSTSVNFSGSNRYAIAFIYAENGVSISGDVTCGGVAMSAVSGANLNSAMGGVCQAFALASPSTGTQTISATLSATSGRCFIYGMAWDGIQAVGNGDTTAGEVASSVLDADSAAGDEVISFCVTGTVGIDMGGTGQTSREDQDNWEETGRSFGCATKTATSTSTQMVWTPASTADCFQVSISLTPIASGYTVVAEQGTFTHSGQEATLTYSNAGGSGGQYGRTTVGGSFVDIELDIQGRLITLPAGQQISSTKAYLQTTNGSTADVKSALVNATTNVVAYESNQLTFSDDVGGWKTITWPSTTPAAGDYYLAISAGAIGGGANTVNIAYDANTSTDFQRASGATGGGQSTYPAFPAGAIVWDGPDNDVDSSMYLETQGGRSLNAETGAFTETGRDVAFIYTRKLAAEAGALAIAGSEAYRDIEIDSEAGAFTIGSGTTNLGVGHKLYADAASFASTGQDVILFYSAAGPRTLTAESALFNIGLVDAVFRRGVKLIADQGQFQILGQPVVGGVPPDTGTRAGGVFKIRKALVVTTSGRAKWVHYIPVKQVTASDINKGTYNNEGAIEVQLMSSSVGLSEWVDYIPVVEVSDIEYERWRTDNSGWIPVIFVE